MKEDKRKNEYGFYTEEFIKTLHVRHVNGESIRQIAISENLDRGQLHKMFKKRNFETFKSENWSRKYRKPFKENWFETIDSCEKAYFLGFIWADGCIMNNGKDSYRLEITLQKSDGYILETFVKLLESDKKVYYNDSKNRARLYIDSKKLVSDLINLGVTYRKTYNSSIIPNIPERFKKDFVLGFFDGDGSIGLYNHIGQSTKVGMVSFVGLDKSLMESIQVFLKSNNVDICMNLRKVKKGHDQSILTTNKSESVTNFINLVYSECPVFLTRKKKIADQANTVLNDQIKK